VSVLDIYNRIQDSVEKSLLDNSLIKDNKLYLINKKYKKYSFLNK